MQKNKLYYLATPYSHENALIRNKRFRMVNCIAGLLLLRKIHVFSPISMTHPIAVECSMPPDFDFYEDLDNNFIDRCDGMIVVMMEGWESSKGVAAEVAYTRAQKKPIFYLNPTDFLGEEDDAGTSAS